MEQMMYFNTPPLTRGLFDASSVPVLMFEFQYSPSHEGAHIFVYYITMHYYFNTPPLTRGLIIGIWMHDYDLISILPLSRGGSYNPLIKSLEKDFNTPPLTRGLL